MSELVLSPDELAELTHLERPSAQIEALKAMRIPYRERPDGTPLVVRSDVPLLRDKPAHEEPDFAAIGL